MVQDEGSVDDISEGNYAVPTPSSSHRTEDENQQIHVTSTVVNSLQAAMRSIGSNR
jgi:hypothetical protein